MTHPKLVPDDLRWHLLECTSVEVEGVKVWGSPWQNWFCNFAFNAPEKNGEAWLAEKVYAHMPEGTDIVVTHGPPYGGDPISPQNSDRTRPSKTTPAQHLGSKALLSRLREVQPKLLVTGHIHSGYGQYEVVLVQDGNPVTCRIVNASITDEKYHFVKPPIEINW
jgi:Icc-related predicted phosphoesterase